MGRRMKVAPPVEPAAPERVVPKQHAASKARLAAMKKVAASFSNLQPASKTLTHVRAVPTCFIQLDHAVRVGGLPVERFSVVHGPSNHGKAQPVDEPVLTPDGWRPIGSLRVGDLVIGSDGRPTLVRGVFPQGRKKIVRVVADDGAWTRCCEEHLWTTTTAKELNRGRYTRGPRPERERVSTGIVGEGSVKTAFAIAETIGEVHYLPRISPVHFAPSASLPMSAYYLGALLGDGGMCSGSSVVFTSADQEMRDRVASEARAIGDLARMLDPVDRCEGVRIAGGEQGQSGGSATAFLLRQLGLMGQRSENKFIPPVYRTATAEDRLELLRGLLDTDGAVSNEGQQAQFSTTSPSLRDGVVDLTRSLGGRAFVYAKETDSLPAWCVMISFEDGTCPFWLARKASCWKSNRERAWRQRIEAVEPCGEAECVCIAVAASDSLYVTRGYLLTHNTVFILGLIKSFLMRDHFALFIDAERTTPRDWVETMLAPIAIDHPGFLYKRPETYEKTIADVRKFCIGIAEAKEAKKLPEDMSGLIVVDSIRKLVPASIMKQIEDENDKGADANPSRRAAQIKAAMNANWLDELVPILERACIGMVVIAREMEDPDASVFSKKFGTNYKVQGGSALIYDASLRMRVERAAWVTKESSKEGTAPTIYGERHRVTIAKTKVGGKDDKASRCYFHTSNGLWLPEGFDSARDILELSTRFGLIEKSGAHYSYGNERLGQGEHNVVKALANGFGHADGTLLDVLERQCREKFASFKPLEDDDVAA